MSGQNKKQSIQLNFSDSAYGALEELAENLDLPMTEVLREALGMLRWVYTEQSKGNRLLIDRAGDIDELIFPFLLRASGGEELAAPLSPVDALAVASLAAFIGGFAGAFAKDLGERAGKTSSEAVTTGARRLKKFIQARLSSPKAPSIEVRDQSHHILVVQNAEQLPDEAWEQLVKLDFPQDQGRIVWDATVKRWLLSRRRRN